MDYIPNIYRTLSMYQTLSTFMYKLIQASQLSLYKGGNSGMRKLMSASKLTQLLNDRAKTGWDLMIPCVSAKSLQLCPTLLQSHGL